MNKLKKLLCLLLSLLLLIHALPALAEGDEELPETEEAAAEETAEEDSQELEASNTIDAATPISFGRTYSGVISDDNTVDYYQFTLPSSGRVTFNASAYMK